jgi:hypothetical protein
LNRREGDVNNGSLAAAAYYVYLLEGMDL